MHWMKRILPTVCALFMAAASPPGHAFMEGFIDPSDGYLDMSDWLVNKRGFLPVPIVITEPAVGYGGGVALMFVRNSIRESAEKAKETGHLTPPDIWVVGGAGHVDWVLAATILGCTALTLVLGYAGTALALRARAAPLLRNE